MWGCVFGWERKVVPTLMSVVMFLLFPIFLNLNGSLGLVSVSSSCEEQERQRQQLDEEGRGESGSYL